MVGADPALKYVVVDCAPLYRVNDIVLMPDLGVIAIVERVHKSIGTLPRYNVIDEDGDRHDYVPEHELYPDILQER